MSSCNRSHVVRSIARRLPIFRAYESRLSALNEQVRLLEEANHVRLANPGGVMFAPPGHFYSPVVDVEQVRARETSIFRQDPRAVAAVEQRIDEQWAMLGDLVPLMSDLDYPVSKSDAALRGRRYFTDNFAYGDSDGLLLGAILRRFRPARLVEFGSGFSSACALDVREHFLGGTLDVTLLDPYPDLMYSLVKDTDRATVRVLEMSTQSVPISVVEQLEANDVLFIDSTHVCKTDSDVNRIFFEILPALRPGVIIHLHDIFQHFEYPPAWVYEGRSWNEQYLLRAFLQYNDAFEILLFPCLLQSLDGDRYRREMPPFVNGGGAFWMRKVR